MATYKGIEINTRPTEAMAQEAKRGLEWRKEHGGGTAVGVARARDISNRKNLALDTVKRMHSFFSRHEVDKKGKGFKPGDGYPSRGRVAWALWGGDAGQSWARNITTRMDAADNKGKDAMALKQFLRRSLDSDAVKRYYSTAKLSDKISETPEGFLICEAVPITRAGDLLYNPDETPVSHGDSATVITRRIEDIHDPETIASFEGKPVTINHPDDFVTPETWRELTVGIVQNVRPGEGDDSDLLLADLLITDFEAIAAVKSKRLREVSCGYEAEYIEIEPGRGRQEGIIGNHVALVTSGRCGSECAIFDHAPEKENPPMTMKEKIMGIFGKALDEAMTEEPAPVGDKEMDMNAALDAMMKRLDAMENAMKGDMKADMKADMEADMDDMKDGDMKDEEMKDEDMDAEKEMDHTPEQMIALEKRLEAIEKMLLKIAGEHEEAGLGGEESEDENEDSYHDQENKTKDMCTDSDVIARAEILSPGIRKTADVKEHALKAAYATADGRTVIDTLLSGKEFDAADQDLLFVGAAEMLKGVRRSNLQTRVSLDSLPSMKAGEMTPEKLNELNAARYGTK